jgi:hypothetical protein
MFQIESGVPIPPYTGKPHKYPFGKMSVGDCFHVPIDISKSARIAAINYGHRNGAKFAGRLDRERGVVRIWRIA